MRLTLWWLLAAYFIFAARYLVPDQFVFFLWFDTVFAVCVGIGTAWLMGRFRRFSAWVTVLGALMPVAVYAVLPPLARRANIPLGVKRDLAYRDRYDYFLRPWRTGYHGPRQFALAAFDAVGPGGVIICDSTTAPVLAYVQQVDGVGRHVVCQLRGPNAYFARHVITEASIDSALEQGVSVATCSRHPQYVPRWLYQQEPTGRGDPLAVSTGTAGSGVSYYLEAGATDEPTDWRNGWPCIHAAIHVRPQPRRARPGLLPRRVVGAGTGTYNRGSRGLGFIKQFEAGVSGLWSTRASFPWAWWGSVGGDGTFCGISLRRIAARSPGSAT